MLIFRIMRHEELSGLIECEHLEALLPDDILKELEEQFLSTKEVYVIMLLLPLKSTQIDCPRDLCLLLLCILIERIYLVYIFVPHSPLIISNHVHRMSCRFGVKQC